MHGKKQEVRNAILITSRSHKGLALEVTFKTKKRRLQMTWLNSVNFYFTQELVLIELFFNYFPPTQTSNVQIDYTDENKHRKRRGLK